MAQRRMIGRDLSTSPRFKAVDSDSARLLYALGFPFTDRDGWIAANPVKIRAFVWPLLSHSEADTAAMRDDLVRVGLWMHFRHENGTEGIWYSRFHDHQPGLKPGSKRYNEEAPSKYTKLFGEPWGDHHGTTVVPPLKERERKERKGKTAPPGAGPVDNSTEGQSPKEDTDQNLATSGRGPLAGVVSQVIGGVGGGVAADVVGDPIEAARDRARSEVLPVAPSADVFEETLEQLCGVLGVERDGSPVELRVASLLARWGWNLVALNALRRIIAETDWTKVRDRWAYICGAMTKAIPETNERFARGMDRALDEWKGAIEARIMGGAG